MDVFFNHAAAGILVVTQVENRDPLLNAFEQTPPNVPLYLAKRYATMIRALDADLGLAELVPVPDSPYIAPEVGAHLTIPFERLPTVGSQEVRKDQAFKVARIVKPAAS
jgi:hypothetical protein